MSVYNSRGNVFLKNNSCGGVADLEVEGSPY
jgi:hypothetical protein